MNKYTSTTSGTNKISHTLVVLFCIMTLSVSTHATGLCGLTLSLNGSASTCVGHDTLSLSGASTGSQIIWQSATTTVAVDSAGGSIDTIFIPAVAGSYIAIVTDPGGCQDTSLAIVVDSTVTPSVTISINTSDTICPNTRVTFSPTVTNSGTPSYQWYLNGTPISSATFYTNSTLSNHDSLWVVVTAHGACTSIDTAMSNVIHITVSTPVTPAVSISTGHSHTICAGTVITFTPTPANGGSSPGYEWYVSGTAVSSSTTFVDSTLHNNDSVWVVMVSNAGCATSDTAYSNVIPYIVNPIVTPSVSITSSIGDTICRNDQVTFFATAVNGGANADYQWIANGVNVGNSPTYIGTNILNGDVYSCVLTSTASCLTQTHATSDTITFVVHPYPAVTTVLTGGSVGCLPDSVGLTATGGTSYLWSDGQTAAAIVVASGTYSVTATNSYGCTAGSNPITVAPHALLTDSLIQMGDTLTLAVSGGEFYQWYMNGNIIGGALSASYIATQGGSYQVSVIDSFGCRSSSAMIDITTGINTLSGNVTMSIYPNPNIGIFTLDCGDDTPRMVSISDDLGRVVMDNIQVIHRHDFDLSSLRDGLYYLHITDSNTGNIIKCSIVR